jgi:hypothetical protein
VFPTPPQVPQHVPQVPPMGYIPSGLAQRHQGPWPLPAAVGMQLPPIYIASPRAAAAPFQNGYVNGFPPPSVASFPSPFASFMPTMCAPCCLHPYCVCTPPSQPHPFLPLPSLLPELAQAVGSLSGLNHMANKKCPWTPTIDVQLLCLLSPFPGLCPFWVSHYWPYWPLFLSCKIRGWGTSGLGNNTNPANTWWLLLATGPPPPPDSRVVQTCVAALCFSTSGLQSQPKMPCQPKFCYICLCCLFLLWLFLSPDWVLWPIASKVGGIFAIN